jgi:hypothetical protein
VNGPAVRLLVVGATLLGLVLLLLGLVRTVYFERTPDAVRSERTGDQLIALAAVVLLAAAAGAWSAGPNWAAVAIAVPAVVCGGLTLLAGGTLLPHLAALPAFALALAGAVAVVSRR